MIKNGIMISFVALLIFVVTSFFVAKVLFDRTADVEKNIHILLENKIMFNRATEAFDRAAEAENNIHILEDDVRKLKSDLQSRFDQVAKAEKNIHILEDDVRKLEFDLRSQLDLESWLREVGLVAYCRMYQGEGEILIREPKIVNFPTVVKGKELVDNTGPFWRFKAEKAGDYIVSVSVGVIGSKGDFMTLGLSIEKEPTNSSCDVYLARTELGPETTTLGGTATVQLKAAQPLDVRVYLDGNNKARFAGTNQTWISIAYFGPRPSE
jgi:hypothetical protein